MASSSEIARVSITGTLDPAVNAGLPGLFAGVTSVSGDVVMTSNYQDHSIVFPRCTRIGGALNLNARQAATVSFPMLRVVGGRLNIQAMCSVSGRELSAGFASLETVGNGLVYGGLAWVPEGGPRRRRFRARRPPIRRGVWGVYSSFSIVLGGISRSHGVLGSMPCRAAMHAPWPWWGQGCVVSTRVGC